jgi:hypothetical protein
MLHILGLVEAVADDLRRKSRNHEESTREQGSGKQRIRSREELDVYDKRPLQRSWRHPPRRRGTPPLPCLVGNRSLAPALGEMEKIFGRRHVPRFSLPSYKVTGGKKERGVEFLVIGHILPRASDHKFKIVWDENKVSDI